MKRRAVALIAGYCFLHCPPAAFAQPRVAAQLMDDLTVYELQKDVLLVTHSYPWPGNSLLVRLNRTNWVWADTPCTPEATRLVVKWLYMKYGERIRITEINTGFHIDNLGGNRELLKWKIPTYGSSLTCELLRTKSKKTMAKMIDLLRGPENEKYRDAYRSFVFSPPTNRFDITKIQTLRLGGNTVEIYFPGPTHTFDNVVVYFPDKRVLFGTCMVLAADAKSAGYTGDADLARWPESLRKVAKRFPRAALVVPGHGEPGGPELIEHSIRVVERSRECQE
ncbi:MAG: MBL fold metallo-hydrolase [Spirochaetales bacterium]|nr:MBL fold metallo-hydrolase [Spirochaetales bacterium]